MRAQVQLSAEEMAALDRLARERKTSRSALVSNAVKKLLAEERAHDARKAAFGAWKDRDIDGVDYQRRLRDEW